MFSYLKSISIFIALSLLCSISVEGWAGQTRKHKRRNGAGKLMSSKQERVPNGIWGGRQMVINVTDQGATLEFVCANGQTTEPLALDSNVRFDVGGLFLSEDPGPDSLVNGNSQ